MSNSAIPADPIKNILSVIQSPKSATHPQDNARDIPEPSNRAVPDSLLISFAAEPAPIVAMAGDIFFLFVLSSVVKKTIWK